jgi:hypothetical protein
LLTSTVLTQAVVKSTGTVKATVKTPVTPTKTATVASGPPKASVKIGIKASVPKATTTDTHTAKHEDDLAAIPKALKLPGSCPGVTAFPLLKTYERPRAYQKAPFCPGLASGCCTNESLGLMKTNWISWVANTSSFFWSLAKIAPAAAVLLNSQKSQIKCGGTGLSTDHPIKISNGPAIRILQAVISAGAKTSGSVGVKVKVDPKVSVNVTKATDAVKSSAAAAGGAVKDAVIKTGDAVVKVTKEVAESVHNIKNTVRVALGKTMKFSNLGRPINFMEGTICHAKFQKAWKDVMDFTAMRASGFDYALKCFKSLEKINASAVCAVCDNKNEVAFKNKSKLSITQASIQEFSDSCAPFLEYIKASFGPAISIADYVASVDSSMAGHAAKLQAQY